VARSDVLISADELAELIDGGEDVAVLDVRWRLDQPDGRAAYEAAHIPGAVYVDLETELADHSIEGRGRHPLPSGADVQAAARSWGVRAGEPVVVYDDWNRAGSARAWWVLKAAGIEGVRILDGGLAAWVDAGRTTVSGAQAPATGDAAADRANLYEGAMPTLTDEEAAALPGTGVLIDARAPERFRGDIEHVDPTAGHIPGAVNVPSTSVLNADGRFKSDGELREIFAGVGVGGPALTGVYCGSGVTASVDAAALAVIGVDAALFPGSWSQWSSDPNNPVATGD
jgi:thiosulfate/3-mercaptopyruvate sulfurtransferase